MKLIFGREPKLASRKRFAELWDALRKDPKSWIGIEMPTCDIAPQPWPVPTYAAPPIVKTFAANRATACSCSCCAPGYT